MIADYRACLDLLERHHIGYTLYEHHVLATAADFPQLPAMQGLVLKNLVLTSRAHTFMMFTLPLEARANLAALAAQLNQPRLTFAGAAELRQLQLIKGMVSPLSLLNDTQGVITYVRAAELAGTALVNCHPLDNRYSIDIRLADLDFIVEQVLDHAVHQVAGCLNE